MSKFISFFVSRGRLTTLTDRFTKLWSKKWHGTSRVWERKEEKDHFKPFFRLQKLLVTFISRPATFVMLGAASNGHWASHRTYGKAAVNRTLISIRSSSILSSHLQLGLPGFFPYKVWIPIIPQTRELRTILHDPHVSSSFVRKCSPSARIH